MTRLKKAFAWLFGNFSSTLMFCWLPALVVQDFLHTDDPDGWDYGIAILMFVSLALLLGTDIITYRKKMRKLDEDLE
ncbi:hypothetical protein N9487_03205 [Cyclobacteriaceae bacterium]|nr:hypothetical protein [Cyclobacteriaceae bacterium]|tara:strand:- start:419 stop:649 length:231 start_codon:yes stop_codon:yes gene_type:complete